MLLMTAVGFIPTQPELVRFPSGSTKVTFEVCDKRSSKESGQWVEVTESAEFFAWGADAERYAELLRPGLTVTALGYQETAKWTDSSGGKHSKKVYRLVDVQLDRSRRPGSGSSGQSSNQGEQNQSAHPRNSRGPESPSRPGPTSQPPRRVESAVPAQQHGDYPDDADEDGMRY